MRWQQSTRNTYVQYMRRCDDILFASPPSHVARVRHNRIRQDCHKRFIPVGRLKNGFGVVDRLAIFQFYVDRLQEE